MARFKLLIEYDGTSFVGWQRQENGPAVQQAIEEAFEKFCGEKIVVHGAGRTDAGVHAKAQVAHVSLAKAWRSDVIRDAVNAYLVPLPIALRAVEPVTDDFEARFSAIKRHYLYRICNRRAPLTFERGFAWHVKRKLDSDRMQEAAQLLIGKHDFSTFRAAECQANSPIRTLDLFDVKRDGDMIDITASARSFLHHQVRSLVGSLELVGSGRWSPADLRAALDAQDRSRCGMVAPAAGLFLVGVDYGPSE